MPPEVPPDPPIGPPGSMPTTTARTFVVTACDPAIIAEGDPDFDTLSADFVSQIKGLGYFVVATTLTTGAASDLNVE